MIKAFRLIYFFYFLNLFYSKNYEENQNKCKDSIKMISGLLSQVTDCFMQNSGPHLTCLICSSKYNLFKNQSNYVNKYILSLSGQNCINSIEDIDKFKTVIYLINNCSLMWKNLKCPYCFIDLNNIEYHKILYTFINKHTEFLNCLKPYISENIYLCDSNEFQFLNITFNTTIGCKICYHIYEELLQTFNKIEGNISGVCGDIENLFNCANTVIEKYFKCHIMKPLFIDFWPIIVIFATTLLFYSCSTMFHVDNKITIYNQTRVMASNEPELNRLFKLSVDTRISLPPTFFYESLNFEDTVDTSRINSCSQFLTEE